MRLKRLRQQLAYKKERSTRVERQLSAARGQITKLQKRAGAGICPCCKRKFQNVARHMKTKHPDFDPKLINLDEEKRKMEQ